MKYMSRYESPLGEVTLVADDKSLVGLWFIGQKNYMFNIDSDVKSEDNSILIEAKEWLDAYFEGKNPDKVLPLHFKGTDFQKEVWKILYTIPYGKTMTYGEIAKMIAKKRGIKRMSSQAIGGAISHNPIAIIVPCHRVIGSDGRLTGYAGGIGIKKRLLELEGINIKD